ncbi:hypothetical protein GGI35DRAFT_21244 [Trichoderma velutinum]
MSKQRQIQQVLAHISRGTTGCACCSPPGAGRVPTLSEFLVFSLLSHSPLPAPSALKYERLSDTCTSRIQDNGPEYVRGSR